MVKEGKKNNGDAYSYRGFNQVSGDQGEFYCRQMYGLMRNPNGENRPDLVSVNGSFKPKLSMEVKTGKGRKGILNLHGLIYGLKCHEDYKALFGEDFKDLPNPELLLDVGFSFPSTHPIACYYNIMHRIDGHKNDALTGMYDALKVRFGDQFIVPFEFAFYSFIVARMLRLKESFETSFGATKQHIDRFCSVNAFQYNGNRPKNFWQNIFCDDILAAFHDDPSLLRDGPYSGQRFDFFREHYDALEDLVRIQIPGPNGTNIYVLSKREHEHLFRGQIQKRISEKRKLIERISHSRLHLVEDLKDGWYHEGEMIEERRVGLEMTPKDIAKANLLYEWKSKADEKDPVFSDAHPDTQGKGGGDDSDVPF